GVVAIELAVGLAAGQVDLRRVDHDDVVTRVEERGVGRLGLAVQEDRGGGGELAEDLVLGVDHEPLAVRLADLGNVCRHRYPTVLERPSCKRLFYSELARMVKGGK